MAEEALAGASLGALLQPQVRADATVHDSFRVPEELATAVARTHGPILLVDDRVDTGWTMTVTARLLRQAGADAILPLALALEA